MLIENLIVVVIGWTPLDQTEEDKSHWIGRQGYASMDIDACMTLEYTEDGQKKFCRTKKVDEIYVQNNTVTIEAGVHRFVLQRVDK